MVTTSGRRNNRSTASNSLVNLVLSTCFISADSSWFFSYSQPLLDEVVDLIGYPPGRDFSAVHDNMRRNNKNILPDGWERYTFEDVYNHFGCSAEEEEEEEDEASPSTTRRSSSSRALPSLEYWLFLRKRYKELVDDTASFDETIPPTQGYSMNDEGPPPFYAKLSPTQGIPSLYATRDIKKGELVHDRSTSDAIFPDTISYRNYMLALPKRMACDVFHRSWARQLNEDGPEYIICLAMDISSLIRSGDLLQANVAPYSAVSPLLYATRDITKDEEILTYYVRLSRASTEIYV